MGMDIGGFKNEMFWVLGGLGKRGLNLGFGGSYVSGDCPFVESQGDIWGDALEPMHDAIAESRNRVVSAVGTVRMQSVLEAGRVYLNPSFMTAFWMFVSISQSKHL